MTIGSSLFLIAVGALLKWAVHTSVKGFSIHTAGVILMVIGIIGLAFALWWTFYWSRRRRTVVREQPVPRERYERY